MSRPLGADESQFSPDKCVTIFDFTFSWFTAKLRGCMMFDIDNALVQHPLTHDTETRHRSDSQATVSPLTRFTLIHFDTPSQEANVNSAQKEPRKYASRIEDDRFGSYLSDFEHGMKPLESGGEGYQFTDFEGYVAGRQTKRGSIASKRRDRVRAKGPKCLACKFTTTPCDHARPKCKSCTSKNWSCIYNNTVEPAQIPGSQSGDSHAHTPAQTKRAKSRTERRVTTQDPSYSQRPLLPRPEWAVPPSPQPSAVIVESPCHLTRPSERINISTDNRVNFGDDLEQCVEKTLDAICTGFSKNQQDSVEVDDDLFGCQESASGYSYWPQLGPHLSAYDHLKPPGGMLRESCDMNFEHEETCV